MKLFGILSFIVAACGAAAVPEAIDYAISAVDPGTDTLLIDVTESYNASASGEVLISIISKDDAAANVQSSTYGWRSCLMTNTGDKRVAAVYMDITNAIVPDMVFDPDGSGGDDVAKPLEHNWGTTETKPISIDKYDWSWLPARDSGYSPGASFDGSALDNVNNLFVDELSDSGRGSGGGYRGALFLFETFVTDETYEFSVDLDPNSIAGLQQGTASIDAEWDVGGVSGAELVGSTVTVLFGDGTTAKGTIASDGSQARGVAVVRSQGVAAPPSLMVGGTETTGGITSYAPLCGGYPTVSVSANVGDRVRVTMMKAFDPVDNQKVLAGGQITAEALVASRLAAQFPDFPVNNARELQHFEVVIGSTGTEDVSSEFSFDGDDALAFSAVVIDGPSGLPLSDVAEPVRLVYSDETCAPTSAPVQTLAPVIPIELPDEPLEYAVVVPGPDNRTPLIQVTDSYAGTEQGEATLVVLPGNSDVQASNYSYQSCKISNTGAKRIAAVYINVANAIIPDIVYDSDGSGGDDVAKGLEHDGGTSLTQPIPIENYKWTWEPVRGPSYDANSAFDPIAMGNVDNLFVDELSDSGLGAGGGYRGLLILFKDFDSNEAYSFSVDMDSNSIAGLKQGTSRSGSNWDVGGVSGAEMIGSEFTVIFGDGSKATGTVSADGSQAGGIAVARSMATSVPPVVSTSSLEYNPSCYDGTVTVTVTADVGQRVRVTAAQGFNAVVGTKALANDQITADALVAARLEAQFPFFPVNNIRMLHHIETVIGATGSEDVTFTINGDDVLAFTAVVINEEGDIPFSDVADVIHVMPSNALECDDIEDGKDDDEECNIPIPIIGMFICLLLRLFFP